IMTNAIQGAQPGRSRVLGFVVGVLTLALLAGGVLGGRSLVFGQGGTRPARSVASKDPNAISKIMEAVRAYQDQREYTKAATILERGGEEHALDAGLRVEYGPKLVSLQKYPEAYAQYEAALSLGAGQIAGAE